MTAWTVGLLLKGTFVLAAGLGAVMLMKRRPAVVRHAVLVATLAAAIALPALSLLLPSWSVPAFDRGEKTATVTLPAPIPSQTGPASTIVPHSASGRDPSGRHALTAPEERDPAPRPWSAVLLAVWAAGALAVLVRFGTDVGRMRSLASDAVRAPEGLQTRLTGRIAKDLGIRGAVRLLFSDRVTVPVTWGVFEPVVILPIEAWEWDAKRTRLVLLHELAHVRRLDSLTWALAETAAAMWWFHPLQWSCRRRLRVEQERACDDVVLMDGVRPSDYASLLVEIARGFSAMERSTVARAAIAMARPSTLADRVESILAAGSRRLRLGRRPAALITLAAAALLLPIAAVHLWGETADARRMAEWIEELESGDAAAREAAAWGLGSVGSERAADLLIERLEDPDPRVRGVAARALGRIGDPAASAPLARLLDDPDPRVRELTVLGLGALAADGLEDHLIRALEDPDMGVRAVAVSVLAGLEGTRAVQALASVASSDPDPHTRGMAISALGKRDAEGRIAVPNLIALLGDREPGVRDAAARALGRIGDTRALPHLVGRLRTEPEAEVRGSIVETLAAFADQPGAVDGLLMGIRDPQWSVRLTSAYALGESRDERAALALLAALRDPVHQVRLGAAWSLDEIEERAR
ncbi:MAG TPA: M56 family metallopeptidase [Gemmatimonadota bacterium]|nr:M56 family metallopeptidase [Gemmatimonadota bacterium]